MHTVLLVLNEHFETLQEASITTLIDSDFGKHIHPKRELETRTFALDDARLFTFQGELWVSYREGKAFGYETQVLNKVHLESSANNKLAVHLKASETETLCCGRNMAFMVIVATP